MKCIETYEEVSSYLGNKLNKVLYDIEKFYYSEFWENRFKRRLREEDLDYNPIEFDIVLGSITSIKEDNVFKFFDKETQFKGVSNKDTMIALNMNVSNEDYNKSHIENVIMHEFGHRQYNQSQFKIVVELNNRLIKNPQPIGLKSDSDYRYFSDKNEIRQRIIPIVKEMYDNNLSSKEIYDLSNNLNKDDLKSIYSKDFIINLLDNIL